MKSVTYHFLVVIAALISFVSCKKGDAGPQGEPGTANVIYSQWFTASPWTKDTVFNVWGFNYKKTIPEITQQVLDSGAVLTFGKLIGYNSLVWPATQVSPLPVNLTYQSGQIMTDTWSAHASPGNLKIRFVNDKNYYSSIAATHQFRYIIIPGGIPAGRGLPLTYEDICKRYSIPE